MIKNILISRTDKIGDVILTLPLTGILKAHFPDLKISFLGRSYTEAIINKCEYVDEFLNWDLQEKQDMDTSISMFKNFDAIVHVFPNKHIAKIAKKAKISIRIGTSHRIFHWLTCNKLINLGRKNSNQHEAQLNIQLLKPLNIKTNYELVELQAFTGWKSATTYSFDNFFDKSKFNLIFHMKSKGSAQEWPAKFFYELAVNLPDNYNIIITGTAEEEKMIYDECPEIFQLQSIKNACGKFSLREFINFIECADGLVACSTGPLHIASASGIYALGLYPSIRPMHPGRWAPIGKKASYIEAQVALGNPKENQLVTIQPNEVQNKILIWNKSGK